MKVTFVEHSTTKTLYEMEFDVQYIRNFSKIKGKKVKSPFGGVTVINFNEDGAFWAKCRDDERFVKKQGILVCLAKVSRKFFCSDIMYITSPSTEKPDQYKIVLKENKTPSDMYWFLNTVIGDKVEKAL